MNDPRRLLEENDDELENAMLRSVRGDSVSREGRQRILAGLGISAAALTASTGAASSIALAKSGVLKGTSAVVVKWLALCSVVSLIPAGVWVARTRTTQTVQLTQPSDAPSRPQRPQPVVEPSPALAIAPPEAPPAAAPPREARAVASPAARSSALSDEVATLQVARTALADRDANAALAALDRYKSRFAGGRLGPEATVLRIEALMLRGDRAQALALADRFESSNPKSPYAERIRSILRQAGGAAREPGSR
jgi:hypothetical protein